MTLRSGGSSIGSCLIVVVSINITISLLLVAGLIYCITQISHLQNELQHLRNIPLPAVNSISDVIKKEQKNGEVSQRRLVTRSNCCGTVRGKRGKPGPRGTKGEKGDIGERGEPGKTGPPGKIVKNTESAHFFGKGYRKQFNFKDIVTSWEESHCSANMKFSNGQLTIGVTGYYYIYSQLCYFDHTWTMGHMMYVGNYKVLEALRSFQSLKIADSQQTMYVGGIFKIERGQRVYVKLEREKTILFNRTLSYFGAFLVHR